MCKESPMNVFAKTVMKGFITCPKCGTAQEKTSTCVHCQVIFEKMAIHSRLKSSDNIFPSQSFSRFAKITAKGCWNLLRHAMPGVIMVLIGRSEEHTSELQSLR